MSAGGDFASDIPADVLAKHIPEIKLHRAWNEYRADCSCGRVGSYVTTKALAARDHAAHVRASTEEGAGE